MIHINLKALITIFFISNTHVAVGSDILDPTPPRQQHAQKEERRVKMLLPLFQKLEIFMMQNLF